MQSCFVYTNLRHIYEFGSCFFLETTVVNHSSRGASPRQTAAREDARQFPRLLRPRSAVTPEVLPRPFLYRCPAAQIIIIPPLYSTNTRPSAYCSLCVHCVTVRQYVVPSVGWPVRLFALRFKSRLSLPLSLLAPSLRRSREGVLGFCAPSRSRALALSRSRALALSCSLACCCPWTRRQS